jgi:hypothetical protein
MTLPKETQQAIANRAAQYADQQHAHKGDDIHIGYLDGATEWAGKAQPVIDISQEIVMLFDPTRRHVLVPADIILRLSAALAKYKEATNG